MYRFLGCASGRHGAKEVMSHPWFSSTINWRRLKAGKDKPPFVPDPHAVYAKGSRFSKAASTCYIESKILAYIYENV